MKKVLIGIMVLVLCISVCGCGDVTVETDSDAPSVEQKDETQNAATTIKSGDKLVTDTKEIAINSVELTYDVLPDDTSGFYTHYEAEAGKVYICVDADVTNKAKQNLNCGDIGTVKANYNDGYTYSGFVIVDDATTGFTYANITNIDPLETKGIKWLIECPQEVEESTNALFLEIKIDGKEFIYTIR